MTPTATEEFKEVRDFSIEVFALHVVQKFLMHPVHANHILYLERLERRIMAKYIMIEKIIPS